MLLERITVCRFEGAPFTFEYFLRFLSMANFDMSDQSVFRLEDQGALRTGEFSRVME